MHDLTVQVTSSLLPFSGATVDALRGNEIALDSFLQGKFSVGRSGLAWLTCGSHLEVVHALTGERLSAHHFSGGGEHPPNVLAVRDFCWLKRSGLLVGLEEAKGSVLCLYDLGLSRVVKAVVIPGRITAIEPLASEGGASTSTQHLHQSLRWFYGIAAVVTDLGHVLLVDLCLDDPSCSQSEQEASDLQVVTKSHADITKLREISTRKGRHLCLQLHAPSGVGVTAVQYLSRTNQLAVGFSDGVLQLWNMKALKKEYDSQLEGGRVPVYAFTFQEPENDPRNCCYLWAVQSSQDHEGDTVSLHLLQLAFSERKCLTSGKILYEGLEYCEERYSQDLSVPAFPLRTQTTNTRLLSCQTIEKCRHHSDRDDSVSEAGSPDTSVSMFSWQVRAYGQGTPSTFIGVFDINRWYHAQMPDSLRAGETLQNCPYLAVWSLDAVMRIVTTHTHLDLVIHERSLSRGLPFSSPPPEQYFNPTTYNFEATCLLNSGIVHFTCSGHQKETLGFLKKAVPCSSDAISTSYSHCLMSGLLSSRLADTQPSSLSQEEQLNAVLSTAVETSSLGLITGCIKQWTAEEQPGSALNLRYILDWAWNKVVQTKEELDGICAPLFDSSSNFTDPQTLQLLQHSQRLLSNLSSIFHCLLSEAQEITQKGLAGLTNKNLVSSLISTYAQVVLWFCRIGLLPEGSDEDALQISRPFYAHSVISNYYTIRRKELTKLAKNKWSADCLMIDGLVSQCGERLTDLWKRDVGGTGQYPPPTLHALLDIYLLENISEASKHAIVIYLLLDVMYSFSNKDGASVESFPTAFAIPIGLLKLVQGYWLLDHHDHQSSFELLLHPAASQFHFEWQHERVLQALMCQGQQSAALRYFHASKPAVSSTPQASLCMSVLLHNRCLVEAWCLLRRHANRLNLAELLGFLYESCQELGLIKELLKLPLGLHEQECLEKFLQGTGGLQNRELLMVHYLQQARFIPAVQLNQDIKTNFVNERDPKLQERSTIRNSIMEKYGKVLPRVQRKLAAERAKPYQLPNTVHREISRPQPLSTVTKRSANDKLMSRAGLINNVLTKIEEVWFGKDGTPQPPPHKSPRLDDVRPDGPKLSTSLFSEPFLGTPVAMTPRRKSRLMNLVRPLCQTPQPAFSPLRHPAYGISPKILNEAPELSLLQTPQIIKRARALVASEPVFPSFTPQSILRSSLRPTPAATPSASPGRSVTPPLLDKESRSIAFVDEDEPESRRSIRWTNGMAADSEISLLSKTLILSKAERPSWAPQLDREDEKDEAESHRARLFPPEEPLLDSSLLSVRSTDTTLEFYNAFPSEDGGDTEAAADDDVVTVNIKHPTETDEREEKSAESSGEIVREKEEDDDETFTKATEKAEEEEEINVFGDEKGETSSLNSELLPAAGAAEVLIKDEGPDVQPEENKLYLEMETPDGAAGDPEPSGDLTQFVLQHLFGGDLAHSGIHDESPTLDSPNKSENSGGDVEINQEEEETPQTITIQKSPTSVASFELLGADSHSVVSINDSEELSSPSSSEEEEEDDDDEEEEEEEELSDQPEEEVEEEEEDDDDSGSEVEIIDEVKGNGRLPPLQPATMFLPQGHAHFLPALSEDDTAAFSLIPPGAEIKMVEDDMEGEVVMVRLGADDAAMDLNQNAEQESSYVELKPSTTLLVPLELVEADAAPLCLPELQEADAHHGFSLMLEMDDCLQKDDDPPDAAEPSGFTFQPQLVDIGQELLGKAEIHPVESFPQNVAPAEDFPEESEEETARSDQEANETGSEHQAEQEAEEKETQQSEPDPHPLADANSAEEQLPPEEAAEMKESADEEKQTPLTLDEEPETEQQKPEALLEAENQRATETPEELEEFGDDEKHPEPQESEKHLESEEKDSEVKADAEQQSSEEPEEEETKAQETVEQLSSPRVQTDKRSSLRTKTPSVPTRKPTRGRSVRFTRLLDKDRPEDSQTDLGLLAFAAPTNRTPRKPRDSKVQMATPRRSARNVHADLPTAEAVAAATPARRSQRKSSQSHRGDGEEAPASDEQDEESATVRSRKTPRKSGRAAELETVEEEKERDESAVRSVKRSARKTELELLTPALPDDDANPQVADPNRKTRRSRKIGVNMEPQVRLVAVSLPPSARNARREPTESEDPPKSEPRAAAAPSSARRATRSKLWDHPEEDLTLLDTPLEVDSEIPVADALIRRLRDEEEKQKGRVTAKSVRSSRSRKTPSAVTDSVAIKEEEDASPEEHTFIYSPARRRQTRANKLKSPEPEGTRTLSRSRVKDRAQDKISFDDFTKLKVTKSRKPSKRTARSRAASELAPIAEPQVISAPPSPANSVPRALLRILDEDAATTTTMHLRRKRVMNTVFSKPVTRRRKL